MQITVPQNTFKKALTLVKKAMPARSTLPILESVRLVADGDSVLIEGNNLDVALQVRIAADVDTPGEAWVNCKGLLALLKGKDPMMIQLDGEKIYIAKKGVTTTMSAQDGSEWPAIPQIESSESIMLKEAMSQCAGFMSTEDTRHFLNGVFIHGGKTTAVVATDGRMLKAVRLKHSIGECGLIIPTSAVKILTSATFPDGLWGIGHSERQVVFKSGDVTLVSRRIEGEYPDYKSVVDGVDKEVSVQVDRTGLATAVREVSAILPKSKKNKWVRLENSGAGKLGIETEHEGARSATTMRGLGEGTVAFYVDPQMFYSALESIEADEVTVRSRADGLGPIAITSEADEDTIVMPRLRGDDV